MSIGSILGDALGVVAQFAPTAARLLGGPVAGVAVEALEDALGLIPPDGAPMSARAQAVAAKLDPAQLTPETIVKLREIDVRLRELDIDLERIEAADRQGARDLQATTRGWTQPLLAWLILTGFFTLVGVILWGGYLLMTGESTVRVQNVEIAIAISNLVGILVGRISGLADQVVSFFFGSSHGSAAKTDAMQASIERLGQAAAGRR